MDFPEYNFAAMNETDVREEIIAPLLRYIGYRSGTSNDIIREQPLKYPYKFLGRKKNGDPELRGIADYICEAENKTRWVIEAKKPSEDISNPDVIEQTWSYANHAEIRAIYFCICNGLELKIFQTNKGPNAPVTFECTYGQMPEKLATIKNILSPAALLRDYAAYKLDCGEPLAPQLRSFAKLTNGKIEYRSNSLNLEPFNQLIMSITTGSVERTEAGKIEAYIETTVPFRKLQDLNEKLGLDKFSLTTEDQVISTDSNKPTTFNGFNRIVLPKGSKSLDILTWQEIEFQRDITVTTKTTAVGFLQNGLLKGTFTGELFYEEIQMGLSLSGEFTAYVS